MKSSLVSMDVWDNISIYFSFDFYSGKKSQRVRARKKSFNGAAVLIQRKGGLCEATILRWGHEVDVDDEADDAEHKSNHLFLIYILTER